MYETHRSAAPYADGIYGGRCCLSFSAICERANCKEKCNERSSGVHAQKIEVKSSRSDNSERLVWIIGQGDLDDIIGRDDSIGDDNGHDTRFANEIACFVVIENGSEEPVLKAIDLNAGISQSSQFDDRGFTKAQLRTAREVQQRNPSSGDVLSNISRVHSVSAPSELDENFLGDEMNLPKIRLGGIAPDAREMLNSAARVRITFHAKACAKRDTRLRCLAEVVFAAQ
jgi:hypothetical protein